MDRDDMGLAACPIPPPQPGAPGIRTSLGVGTGQGQARMWACGWAQLSRDHGWVGPACGLLEAGPAEALLGQGLMAPGAEMGSWALGRVGCLWMGTDSKAWGWPWGPDGYKLRNNLLSLTLKHWTLIPKLFYT